MHDLEHAKYKRQANFKPNLHRIINVRVNNRNTRIWLCIILIGI